MHTYPMTRTVSTDSLFNARCSVALIRESYYHLTGTWCTLPEALAAAFSVPDGTPVDMAAVNVGVAMCPVALAEFERTRGCIQRLA